MPCVKNHKEYTVWVYKEISFNLVKSLKLKVRLSFNYEILQRPRGYDNHPYFLRFIKT